jgi:hypothetical protein
MVRHPKQEAVAPPRAKRKELIRRRPLRGLLLAARPVRALRHRGRKTAWAPRQRAWPGNCGESVPWGGRDALCPFAASGEKHHQLSRALSLRERRPANGRLALQARPLSGKQAACRASLSYCQVAVYYRWGRCPYVRCFLQLPDTCLVHAPVRCSLAETCSEFFSF